MGLSSFVEQVVVLNILRKALQEGDGLVEEDGDCDLGDVTSESIAQYGEEVGTLWRGDVRLWRGGFSSR